MKNIVLMNVITMIVIMNITTIIVLMNIIRINTIGALVLLLLYICIV